MNRKKYFLCCVVLLGLASCSDQLLDRELMKVERPVNQVVDEYHYYLEKARWGDGEACMKLADYYRQGIYVKSDFISMSVMLLMAEQYSGKKMMYDYLNSLPQEDHYRLLFESLDCYDMGRTDVVLENAEKIISIGSPDGYILKGLVSVDQGNKAAGLESITYGAEQGSTLGKLMICMFPSLSGTGDYSNLKKLEQLAEDHPIAYRVLGDIYAGMVCDSIFDEELAVDYYRKSEEHGFLGKRGADTMLKLINDVGAQPKDPDEIYKLKILSGIREGD